MGAVGEGMNTSLSHLKHGLAWRGSYYLAKVYLLRKSFSVYVSLSVVRSATDKFECLQVNTGLNAFVAQRHDVCGL